jgi:hypothetical protein
VEGPICYVCFGTAYENGCEFCPGRIVVGASPPPDCEPPPLFWTDPEFRAAWQRVVEQRRRPAEPASAGHRRAAA